MASLEKIAELKAEIEECTAVAVARTNAAKAYRASSGEKPDWEILERLRTRLVDAQRENFIFDTTDKLREGGSFDDPTARIKDSTISCTCGQRELLVNWIDAPYTGGYCRVTCPKCKWSTTLIDDYS